MMNFQKYSGVTYHHIYFDDDFIVNFTIEVNHENMQILINDTKYPFGHGYCLAMELLGIRQQVVNS